MQRDLFDQLKNGAEVLAAKVDDLVHEVVHILVICTFGSLCH